MVIITTMAQLTMIIIWLGLMVLKDRRHSREMIARERQSIRDHNYRMEQIQTEPGKIIQEQEKKIANLTKQIADCIRSYW